MKLGKYVLVILSLIFAFSVPIYAAPVGLTSEADATTSAKLLGDTDLGVELSLGAVVDIITERKIDIAKGEFEMQAYTARIGLTVMQRFNLYVDVGQAASMEYKHTTTGENHTVSYDDDIIWGIGLSGLIHRWANGLEIGANASYRQAELNLDKVLIDSTTYQRSALTNISEDNLVEYQAGLEVAWRTEYFIPYVGAKFSEVELGSNYTVAPASIYNAKDKNADKNYGVFVGLSIIPKGGFLSPSSPDSAPLSINLEGRFIDEEAFTAAISYKF